MYSSYSLKFGKGLWKVFFLITWKSLESHYTWKCKHARESRDQADVGGEMQNYAKVKKCIVVL